MAWRGGLMVKVQEYFRQRAVLYFMVVILFVVGTIFGALAVNALSTQQKTDLAGYLEAFFRTVSWGGNVNRMDVMRDSFMTNVVKTVGLTWILGLSLVGIPFILIIVFTRGFVLGFTVGFLVKQMAYRGILVALIAVLPHNLLVIPSLVVVSVAGISFGLNFLRGRFGSVPGGVWPEFFGYTLLNVICGAGMVVAALVEAYLTPGFIQVMGRWLI